MPHTKRHSPTTADAACDCGSGRSYAQCCKPFHDGKPAPTAEQLMRSRYTAFVRLNQQYLMDSWHPDQRPSHLELDTDCRWLGLKIKQSEQGQPSDAEGTVQFVARYRTNGKGHRLEEHSYFIKQDGRWYYHSAL